MLSRLEQHGCSTSALKHVLRTLDVIHLASALSVRDELTTFCCYDRRLLDAAGLVHAPDT